MQQSNDGSESGAKPDGLRPGSQQRDWADILDEIIAARSSREQIRTAVRPLCVRARSDNMDAAELVKLVKQSFAESRLVNELSHAGDRQQALDRIISVCIDEYYGGG